MNGFFLTIGITPNKFDVEQKYFLNQKENYYAKSLNTNINNFDKTYHECDEYLIIIEGVILNKNEILLDNWIDTIITLYKNNGETFFNIFRGSFSGVFFDKRKNKWIIYTDHIGSKHVYYNKMNNNQYIFSSKIANIINLRKEKNIKSLLNTNAAYMLLSYGYLISKFTLTKDIFKLQAGHYIVIEKNELKIKQYHIFTNKPNYNLSDEETLRKINTLFKQAIDRQFKKDNEYKLKHFVGLSGGLDSRLTSLGAHSLGYENQINFTFSQSNYLDETIPKKITTDLKHEWIFKSLDNGLFLKNIDETTLMSEGNVSYFGLAHGNSLYKYLNFKELGIIHTGQLGDVILGTYSSFKNHTDKFSIESGAFSKKFIPKIDFKNIDIRFENEEIFKFYLRGFSGMNAGLLSLQHYSETMSPFYDVDFMEFALSIPVEKRYNHKIYKQWISKYHIKTTQYIWEKTGKKPINSIFDFKLTYKGKKITLKKILVLAKIIKAQTNTKKHMNPFTYWYNNNTSLKEYLDEYFKTNINLLNDYKELKEDTSNLYHSGNITEKGLVLSLLSYLKVIH